MSDTLKTVFISLGTSLIVSLITFILGLRSGKNQADRQKMQELYKQLYSHFADLKKSIQEDRSKTWDNYEHINRGNRILYTPPVRKLELSGDLIYLKKRIADEASELEMEIMNYGSDRNNAAKDIHEVILSNLELFKDGYKFEAYSNKDSKNILKTANPTGCNSHLMCSYNIFFNKEHFEEMLNNWAAKKDHALDFSSRGNPPSYSFCLYPDSLVVPTEEFKDTLIKGFQKHVKGYTESDRIKSQLLRRIDKLERKLRRRAKEPVSFWETFFGAFVDLFR